MDRLWFSKSFAIVYILIESFQSLRNDYDTNYMHPTVCRDAITYPCHNLGVGTKPKWVLNDPMEE